LELAYSRGEVKGVNILVVPFVLPSEMGWKWPIPEINTNGIKPPFPTGMGPVQGTYIWVGTNMGFTMLEGWVGGHAKYPPPPPPQKKETLAHEQRDSPHGCTVRTIKGARQSLRGWVFSVSHRGGEKSEDHCKESQIQKASVEGHCLGFA